PSEAKTAEGFIKQNFTSSNLKGIFAAGSIVESVPDQQIMLSASGFSAATNAVHYLASPEASAASKVVVQQPAAVLTEDKTKLAEVQTITTASVQTSEAKADITSEPAPAGKTPSAEASFVTKVPTVAPASTKLKPKLSKGRRLRNKTSPSR
ncbi:MAG: hypothetical protein ACTS4Z_01965, partial [Candidatus Hodgkinia cicadicola]